ncbi:CAP domain-containing protein [Mucor lusitanicus]|uniref:CAP domain-containing protein n=1 Tax=Mucor circinelloides f. lusitanicus TaxID=29924 RepID=A0A8H4B755_MUCCL|nr:CAP domain-containing protein [Mucor lusitanicus]
MASISLLITSVLMAITCCYATNKFSLKNAALEAHNALRDRHNVNPVRWDATLARHAQNWANQCYWGHSDDRRPYHDHCGENIGYGQPSISAAINEWYKLEIGNYDFQDGESWNGEEVRHFTQVVWEETTRIGCAEAYCEDMNGYYYVCNYYPPGNKRSAYVQNVLPVAYDQK